MACPTVLLLLLYRLPESPRWLMSKGRFEEARVVLQKCAKVNGVTLPDDIVGNDTLETGESHSVLKILTVPRLLVRTLIIYLNWIVVNMVYYGLSLNVGNLSGDIYVNFAINSFFEFAAYGMCLLLLNRVGRKWLHSGSMILGGAACLSTIFTVLYANENQHWITVMLANIGKFGISAAFGIIYVWTAELFPTVVRSSGVGSSTMMGRVGSMLCPYIVEIGTIIKGDFGKALALIIFGSMAFIAGLLSLLLPETRGTVLPETIKDAENFGRIMKPPVADIVLQDDETGL
ncbi:organic cation transporter protein-like [Dreissena polymorpha]|nr:organic cation transporter protein-like [Dreissena polymorpha]